MGRAPSVITNTFQEIAVSKQQESIERLLVRAIVADKVRLVERGVIHLAGDTGRFTRRFMVTTDAEGVPADLAVLRESLERALDPK